MGRIVQAIFCICRRRQSLVSSGWRRNSGMRDVCRAVDFAITLILTKDRHWFDFACFSEPLGPLL